MKIGFTGTREGMTILQKSRIQELLIKLGVTEIHHGDCVGADYDIHSIARDFKLRVVLHPPTNQSNRAFCTADVVQPAHDYLVRNHNIVDSTDALFAAPRTTREEQRSGTWATIRYARKCNKKVYIFTPREE